MYIYYYSLNTKQNGIDYDLIVLDVWENISEAINSSADLKFISILQKVV